MEAVPGEKTNDMKLIMLLLFSLEYVFSVICFCQIFLQTVGGNRGDFNLKIIFSWGLVLQRN